MGTKQRTSIRTTKGYVGTFLKDQGIKVVRYVDTSYGEQADCICPMHDDNDASFRIHLTSGQWICFRCNLRGRNLASLARWLNTPSDQLPPAEPKNPRKPEGQGLMDPCPYPVTIRKWTVAEEQAHRDRMEARRNARRGFRG